MNLPKVFVIYTGGTIGSRNIDVGNPLSPLVPSSFDEVLKDVKTYNKKDKILFFDNASVKIDTYSFEDPIDSSDINAADWKILTRLIEENYKYYDGFVILHGTDTMAYTASALTFMCKNICKPIIFTGSQRPIVRTRTDADQNLVSAIEIAASKPLRGIDIPEVCVFFRNKLLRGCRTTKFSAKEYDGFMSHNYPVLGEADEVISIHKKQLKILKKEPCSFNSDFNPSIICLTILPGIDPNLIRTIITSKYIKAIILRSYGSGNTPTNSNFHEAISEGIKEGKIIFNISQCPSGFVRQGLYKASTSLMSAGVISGVDLTLEAAYCKLGKLLAEENDIDIIKDKLQINYHGEQSHSTFNIHFKINGMVQHRDTVSFSQKPVIDDFNLIFDKEVENAYLKIFDLSPTNSPVNAEITVYLGIESAKGGEEKILLGIKKFNDIHAVSRPVIFNVNLDQLDIINIDLNNHKVTITSKNIDYKNCRIELAIASND